MKISTTHPVFPWLVEHAGDLLTKYSIGRDGRTAYERLKEKKASGEMYEFGSFVMHRLNGKVPGGVIQERFFEGVWLGRRFGSGEHVVAMQDGKVYRTRTIQ